MKKIILTGSASGFGLLTAKTLVKQGHTVYATMRNINGVNAEPAKALKEWAKAHNGIIEIVELDVTSDASVAKAISEITEKSGGHIDVLINNAGISYIGIAETLTIQQTEQLFQVNVIGPDRMIKAVLPLMHQQKSGLIINLTSVQARNVGPLLATYNSTKAALDALSVGYHYELKSAGIDVAVIQPGAYQTTDITAKALQPGNPGAASAYGQDVHRLKAGLDHFFTPTTDSSDPQEVADAVAGLLELPAGERPLWTVVGGATMTQYVQQINQATKGLVETMIQVLS